MKIIRVKYGGKYYTYENIHGISMDKCVDILSNLLRYNEQPESPCFMVLTDVQAAALDKLLRHYGYKKSKFNTGDRN